jgi:Cof subfamily protein (haloacid dehalogenase superfamily)
MQGLLAGREECFVPYKLMAVDIDGTLLDSEGRLTGETEKAIKLGLEKGLIFTISTGRPVQGVQAIIDRFDADLPVIAYNGAMVILGRSREILYKCSMNPEDAMGIISLGEKYDTCVLVWVDSKLYANNLCERAYEYSKISGVAPVLMENAGSIAAQGVLKILWYDTVEAIEEYRKDIDRYFERDKCHISRDNINYHTSRPYFLEFVDKKASKARAMEKLGEFFGVDRSEMIAVGDGFNDLSMIEYAGLGVAMGNAHIKIKEKADYVTLANDENGVAHVIYKFILAND